MRSTRFPHQRPWVHDALDARLITRVRPSSASSPRHVSGIYSFPMSDEPSNDLVDGALADEIELVSDLVVAASTSPRHFTPEEVDALLGIEPDAGERPADKATAG